MSQSSMQTPPIVTPFTASTTTTRQSTLATTPRLPVRRNLASAGRIPITTSNVAGTSRAELASLFKFKYTPAKGKRAYIPPTEKRPKLKLGTTLS